MRHCLRHAAFFLLLVVRPAMAATGSVSDYLQTGFTENKGQFIDDYGNARPDILYRAAGEGMDIYITGKGLSYVFKVVRGKPSPAARSGSNQNQTAGWCRADMTLKDAVIRKENIEALLPAEGYSNYFLAHCRQGITGVRTFTKLVMHDVYPGIDWVLTSDAGKGFKYDFIVHPGADVSVIRLKYTGAVPESATHDGASLDLATPLGIITEGALFSYEKNSGRPIGSRFIMFSGDEAGFETESYNKEQTLVIDPPLRWCTFYGGTSGLDGITRVVVDASGNLYALGYTVSGDFPLQTLSGAYNQGTLAGSGDAAIVKFNAAGARQWATYYGGSQLEYAMCLGADASGNVFISGYTYSTDLLAAVQTAGATPFTFTAGTAVNDNTIGGANAWTNMTNAQGSANDNTYALSASVSSGNATNYLKATNFGFSLPAGAAILGVTATLDWHGSNSNVLDYSVKLVVGGTVSGNEKATNASVSPTTTDVTKTYGSSTDMWGLSLTAAQVNNAGFGVAVAATKPGGGGTNQLYVDRFSMTVYYSVPPAGAWQPSMAGGDDVFVTKFNTAGSVAWATYYGGSNTDYPHDLGVDAAGNIYITGETQSTNFPCIAYTPVVAGQYNQTNFVSTSQDAFILKLDNGGTPKWATYYSGGGAVTSNSGRGIAIDQAGNVYVVGNTLSTAFPLLAMGGAYNQSTLNGGTPFILKFTSTGVRQWATYYGGRGIAWSAATDMNNNLYVAGYTQATNFPCQLYTPVVAGQYNQSTLGLGAGAFQNGFILKFNSGGARQWATYYGGESQEEIEGLNTDSNGNVFIVGTTYSTSLPVQNEAGGYNQATNASAGTFYEDMFILKFASDGVRNWGTYFGGSDDEKEFSSGFSYGSAVDADGCLYIGGNSASADLPITPLTGAYNQSAYVGGMNGFIAKFCSAVLPINLLSFTGKNEGAVNVLSWETASERNNARFLIERKIPGNDTWESVGNVPGAGNSASSRRYNYSDHYRYSQYPTPNAFYYRLKQTDYDGQYSYSEVIAITAPGRQTELNIFPVPARDVLHISFRQDAGKNEVALSVYDLVGEEVKKISFGNLGEGSYTRSFGVEDLPPGIYYLSISLNGRMQNSNLTVYR